MRRIAHISDLHFGRIDPAVVEGLAANLAEARPDLLIVSGDLSQRARRSQFEEAARFLRRLLQPRLIVPGNHDVPLFDVIRRFFFPLDRYKQWIEPNLSPRFADDELAVAALNTARSFTQASGWTQPKELEQACDWLAGAPAGVMKLLVTHHPLVPPLIDPGADVLLDAPAVLSKISSCGVDLVLAGHLHRAYARPIRELHPTVGQPILSIQASTATSTRRRGEPNSFNWLVLDREQVRIEVREWNGSAFVPAAAQIWRRDETDWRRHDSAVATPALSGSPADRR